MKYPLFAVVFFFFLTIVSKAYSQETNIAGRQDSTIKNAPKMRAGHSGGKFGLSVSAGISKVLDSDYPKKKVEDSTTTRPFMPAAQVGFYYKFYFGKHSVVTVEPCFSAALGKGRTVITGPGFDYVDELRKRLFFLGLPVSYGLNFRRFSVNIGVQPSFLIFGQTQTHKVYITPVNNIPRGKSDLKAIESNPFDLGAKGEITYNIYKRLLFSINMYYGFMDVCRPAADDPSPPAWYVRQLTIGVKCPLDRMEKGAK